MGGKKTKTEASQGSERTGSAARRENISETGPINNIVIAISQFVNIVHP